MDPYTESNRNEPPTIHKMFMAPIRSPRHLCETLAHMHLDHDQTICAHEMIHMRS